MKKALRSVDSLLWVLLLVSVFLPALMHAANDVMGEIQFEGKYHVEKTSGVWVDGAYVGYLKERVFSASLRNSGTAYASRSISSMPRVLREKEIQVMPDAIADLMADGPYMI